MSNHRRHARGPVRVWPKSTPAVIISTAIGTQAACLLFCLTVVQGTSGLIAATVIVGLLLASVAVGTYILRNGARP